MPFYTQNREEGEKMGQFLLSIDQWLPGYLGFLRYVAPVLTVVLLVRCFLPLLTFKRQPEIWAWLRTADNRRIPVTHWENVIGRSKNSDIRVNSKAVSRNHAVLTRYDDGSWTITDTDSRNGTFVNGQKVDICPLEAGDVIRIGKTDLEIVPISAEQEAKQAKIRRKAGDGWQSIINLILLSVLQLLTCGAFLMGGDPEATAQYLKGFGIILLTQWLLLGFYAAIHRASFEVETIAFFLSTMGMAAICTVRPSEADKQAIAMVLGVLIFLVLGWSLRDLERAKRIRYLAVIAGVGFLVITLVFGREYYGAKNWLVIGGTSLQPSELSKVCFVYAGASTMDRILNKRNMILFIAYSIVICGLLALMNDFGTALIFFCAFLVIAYMRSGSVGTVGLAITALGYAGVLAIDIAPHALRRFSAWRHVWDDPLGLGYQQTRALKAVASGGIFGQGGGQGSLKHVFAADSDIAFATISEEWGLIMAVMMVLCIVALVLFTFRSTRVARSTFYTIGSCTAASILTIQVILNVLGTVDVLPLTGVTFPFLSNGGTSMIGAWGLLAFVKAADTRQNASFAVRIGKQGGQKDE